MTTESCQTYAQDRPEVGVRSRDPSFTDRNVIMAQMGAKELGHPKWDKIEMYG